MEFSFSDTSQMESTHYYTSDKFFERIGRREVRELLYPAAN